MAMIRDDVEGRNQLAVRLFAGLPRRYDLLAEALSFAQNRRWRSAMVDEVAAARPGAVLDVATGTAGVALLLAERTSASITGVDLSEQMLAEGRRTVAEHGLEGRITLQRARAEQLPFGDASFDALTFTYLLRYVDDPGATVAELARVVRPGGTMASLEFFVPPNPAWHGLWWLYTRALLPVGGLAGGRPWFDVGRFLGPSISEHYRRHPLPAILDYWRAAGMTGVRYRLLSLGGGVVIWGRRDGG